MDERNPFLVKRPSCFWVVSQIHMPPLSVHFAVWATWRPWGRRHQELQMSQWRCRGCSVWGRNKNPGKCRRQLITEPVINKALWYSCSSHRCYSASIAGSVQRWPSRPKIRILLPGVQKADQRMEPRWVFISWLCRDGCWVVTLQSQHALCNTQETFTHFERQFSVLW